MADMSCPPTPALRFLSQLSYLRAVVSQGLTGSATGGDRRLEDRDAEVGTLLGERVGGRKTGRTGSD